MALKSVVEAVIPASYPGLFAFVLLGTLAATVVHYTFLDPLRHVPGPLICRLTSCWMYYHSYAGDECTKINDLHKRHGPVVRIAPNEVSISDGAALAPIYADKGGFMKAPCYSNFDIEGHATIFSTRDPAHRAVRSKAVLPVFSMSSVRAGSDKVEECVNRLIARLRDESERSRRTKQPANVLNLARSLALDAVSSYLFGRAYGAVGDKSDKMPLDAYVDALVAVGRFFFLPHWLFSVLESNRQRFWVSKEENASTERVNTFVAPLVRDGEKDDTTYQGRLLKAGISAHETEVQCKDLIFAGTDSTGTNFGVICFYLAKHPDVYNKLREEIARADSNDPSSNPQSLRYLDAVVREGLRMSMANPARFPRVVPRSGWSFEASNGKTFHFAPGTLVGAQPFTLHFNPRVFPEPDSFRPERWLDATPEMQRDWIPFGLGARQCIARNLAMTELLLATRALARDNVLEGAKSVDDRIEQIQWFNSKIVGGKIELIWD